MLTPSLVRLRTRPDGTAEPCWLSARDDVWIRALLEAVDARVGRPAGNLEGQILATLDPLLIQHNVRRQVARGVLRVALRSFKRAVDAPADPATIRREVFRAAAASRSASPPSVAFATVRPAALAAAASALGLHVLDVETGLFADHPDQRLLVAKGEPDAPHTLREAYQLALLQGCLLRSSEVRLWVRASVRAVARFAKLERLMCTFTLDDTATRIDLSGPLALFHATLKYGRALATFIPTVFSTPGWRLEAQCTLEEEPLRVVVDASAPLPRPHALPSTADSRLEEALARDLRRLQSPWTVVREAAAIHVDQTVFFPDFLLVRDGARVPVEVVGYWTQEYLDSKLRALRAVRDIPLVVAVAAERDWQPADLPSAVVLPFKKKLDAAEVIAAAERAVAPGRT